MATRTRRRRRRSLELDATATQIGSGYGGLGKGTQESRSEIGKTWHLLLIEEQAKFGQPDDSEVAARDLSGEQPYHHDNVIPNNSDLPPTNEEILATTNHLGHEAETINTKYLGDQISISGDVPNLDFWKSKFSITSCGIFLKDIEHSLEEMTTTDDEFKVTLCLFLLGSILFPLVIDYVQTRYLIPLRDVGSISMKNWSSWCFSSLCGRIKKFQKNRQRMKTCCISGCVLFLQISVEDFFKQPTPSEGQYDGAAHGETSHANQGPIRDNNAHMKGIADVLQVVKEIQSTLKTELDDV
ncbi:hypothetical protein LWI28_017711 [Acer negundo]|uniref:Uncharacterized protein n=1 Tax=Acer negundo TaxID=4023 RepID=A0AAD5NXN2_ACENE|nr:hypothetical protein LWI28_017711 [Acer negundo]